MAVNTFGTNDCIFYSSDPLGGIYQDYTLMCWFKVATNQYWPMLSRRNLSGYTIRFIISRTGKLFFDEYNNTNNFGTTTVCNTGWRHGALVRSASTVTMYLDGVSDFTESAAAPSTTYTQGCVGNVAPTVTQGFMGSIFDARMYSAALSQETIALIFAAKGRDGLLANCALRTCVSEQIYGLGSLSGKKIYDYSGNGRHVTASGAPYAIADPFHPFPMEDA